MPRLMDLSYMRFGRLMALDYVGNKRWRCICECGQWLTTTAVNLKGGLTKSCGCLRRECHGPRTHSLSHTPEYQCWLAIINRCYNTNANTYPRYGGRGIKMHEPWRTDFMKFYTDVGPRPTKDHSLDRYPDNNGDYEPSNVRWATRKEQGRNMRSNRLVEWNGAAMPVSEFAEQIVMDIRTVRYRLDAGWSLTEIAFTPINGQ